MAIAESGFYLGRLIFKTDTPPPGATLLKRYVRVRFQDPTPCRYVPFFYATAPFSEAQFADGAGMLAGTLTKQGVAAGGRVAAFDRGDMAWAGSTRADPVTGEWKIHPLIAKRKYTVIAQDDELNFNAVLADGVEPVPWED